MGGIGSGRNWLNTRPLTTDCKRLDVMSLQRRRALAAGTTGTVDWSVGTEKTDCIYFEAREDALRLVYNFQGLDEDDQLEDSLVPLVWSRCRYGGKRPYFRCPSPTCGKMVEHLYSHGGPFLCRYCLNLAYPSQNEDAADRASRKANKIRVKLGGRAGILTPFPARPKSMHWRTYLLLSREALGAGNVAFEGAVKKLGYELPEHLRA